MSIILTRSPLEPIGMNGGVEKRRSARLSQDAGGENEPPSKKTKVNGASTTTVTTKQQDGEGKSTAKRKRKVYDEEVEGFSFSKGRRGKRKETKEAPPVEDASNVNNMREPTRPPASDLRAAPISAPALAETAAATALPVDDAAPKTAQKKTRRRFPTTPEREVVEKPKRRSKRLSNEKDSEADPQQSPQRPSHARSHANTTRDRSPSPEKARPVTVEKKRKRGANGIEDEKVMTIALPFADTPVIRRNKEMRKNSADKHRRSSAGMRGKRASSLIDEGRGHALPHAEVPTSEFFKHISADLTEPRRMRCLLGWCGTRSLPSKPEPPKETGSETSLELQAMQAARIIQEELSRDLVTKGILSDWFSRDDSAPPLVPLRKKKNPRNVANAAKAEELERELARLQKEHAEWDEVIQSASTVESGTEQPQPATRELSPLRTDLLDTPQRAIFEQLQDPAPRESTDPAALQQRLRNICGNLEFTVDQFAHGVHALITTRETAERVADRSLAEAAKALEERDKQRAASGQAVNQMDALRGLARVLNSQMR